LCQPLGGAEKGSPRGTGYPTATPCGEGWRADEGFDGRPCGAVSQRPETKRPDVAQLLPDGCREVCGLKMSSLGLGLLEAGCAVVGGVQAVASALDRPDREAIRCSERTGLCWGAT
jgi:hypothetical protein